MPCLPTKSHAGHETLKASLWFNIFLFPNVLQYMNDTLYYVLLRLVLVFTIFWKLVIAIVKALFVPRLFEEKRRDTVFGFPWCVARAAWYVARGA